ncbi:MAG: hypothetical protein A2Y56_00400 [Candidatus Aminicenantes bacterium RBG_13_63_10]|nr:MAG: hypothetical protein A2Y56_00400 [Candidatus Aminicenantes bacterium RBG_13_63_10]
MLLAFLTGPFFSSPESTLHGVWAVKDCRVVTLAGPPLEKGTVIIRDGLIESVGPAVAIPADAEVIDGSGLTVYPGLIDALNQSLLKLPEVKFDQTKLMTGQYTDEDRGLTPERRAFEYFDLTKASLEKHHSFGLTVVQVLPSRGLLTGQAAVFCLSGQDKNTTVVLRDHLLGIAFSPAGFNVYPNSLMGSVAFLRQELSDAVYGAAREARWKKDPKGNVRSAYHPRHAVLSEFASGRKPVVFLCGNQYDLRRALEISAEFKLDALLADLGSESWRLLPELKKAGARVLCPVDFKVPGTSIHAQRGKAKREAAEKELYVKNPARLAEAGIPFALVSLGADDPKSLMEGVRKAVENGLPAEKALEALTSAPARLLGLERALGSVEKGKIANLVLVEGDLLAAEPKIHTVFADGKKFEVKKAKAEAGAAPEVNVGGKWELDIQGAGLKVTVDFLQEGGALSGKMTTPFGVFDFTGGTVSGKTVYFEVNLSVGGQDIDLYFSAAVADDRMTGSVVQGTQGAAEFTAKRIPG